MMRTALYERHVGLGGKLVPFAGWEMPIQYTGILQEHKAVREGVGIFDVSHMGRILVEGPEAEKFLDSLSTNKITGKPPFSATYTVLPNEEGTCVDDVIIYKEDPFHFFLIVNAGNRENDLKHLLQYASGYDVKVFNTFEEEGILSLQGPLALTLIASLFPEVTTLQKMKFLKTTTQGTPLILATTGYTGEEGVEIYAPHHVIISLWDDLTSRGAVPIGLGARDTLRLEMGYALYGHELSLSAFPQETVSAWTLRMEERTFLGKEAIEKRKEISQKCQRGVILEEKGIPREGYEVYKGEKLIGQVTSGTFSPSIEKGIAIVKLETPLKEGDDVEIQIRQQRVKGKIVSLPFYRKVKT